MLELDQYRGWVTVPHHSLVDNDKMFYTLDTHTHIYHILTLGFFSAVNLRDDRPTNFRSEKTESNQFHRPIVTDQKEDIFLILHFL